MGVIRVVSAIPAASGRPGQGSVVKAANPQKKPITSPNKTHVPAMFAQSMRMGNCGKAKWSMVPATSTKSVPQNKP